MRAKRLITNHECFQGDLICIHTVGIGKSSFGNRHCILMTVLTDSKTQILLFSVAPKLFF